MDYILLLIVGLFAGTIGSLIGLGGGIVVVPLLIGLGSAAVLGAVSPQVAVGTSMVTVVFTGLSSTLIYMKHKRVDYKSGLVLFLGSGPAGILGSYANGFLSPKSFALYFGLFMIFVSLLLMVRNQLKPLPLSGRRIWKRTFTDASGQTEYGFNPVLAILISCVVGFLSGLFGIGGGSLLVPAMVLLFSFPPHVAVATSMLIVFLSAVVSSATHIALGNVSWLYAAALIPGAWFGGRLGAYINTRLSGQMIINILRVTLILVGIRLIASAL